MTKTEAKRGQIPHKSGYGRDDISYDYIKNIAYDETQKVYDVVAGLRGADKSQQLDSERMASLITELKNENVKLSNALIKLSEQIEKLETKYYEALKGVITR